MKDILAQLSKVHWWYRRYHWKQAQHWTLTSGIHTTGLRAYRYVCRKLIAIVFRDIWAPAAVYNWLAIWSAVLRQFLLLLKRHTDRLQRRIVRTTFHLALATLSTYLKRCSKPRNNTVGDFEFPSNIYNVSPFLQLSNYPFAGKIILSLYARHDLNFQSVTFTPPVQI